MIQQVRTARTTDRPGTATPKTTPGKAARMSATTTPRGKTDSRSIPPTVCSPPGVCSSVLNIPTCQTCLTAGRRSSWIGRTAIPRHILPIMVTVISISRWLPSASRSNWKRTWKSFPSTDPAARLQWIWCMKAGHYRRQNMPSGNYPLTPRQATGYRDAVTLSASNGRRSALQRYGYVWTIMMPARERGRWMLLMIRGR